MGKEQKPSFGDRAKAQSARPSLRCGVCLYLAELPDGYREEVLTAMQVRDITTSAILAELEADGHPPPNVGSFKRHRSGICQLGLRRKLLGDLDGVYERD